jgi:hypothetical protein
MPLEMATITCGCGSVQLTLPNAVPKYRCGCCCNECLQRVYIGTNGAPPPPLALLKEPLDLLYIDSQIMKPDSQTLAKLAVFKLNHADAPNINLQAKCCGSVLATENAEFHRPHTIATFNNLGPFLKCEFSNLPEPVFNVFTKDWAQEKTQALSRKEKAEYGHSLLQIPDPRAPIDEPAFHEGIAAMQSEAHPKPEGSVTFAKLIENMEMEVNSRFYDETH